MTFPLISAVIPTYNRGRLAARAIESALEQQLAPAEIIVVDDGSNDDTRTIVERHQGNSIPVRYIFQENLGVAAARNRGVANAKHEWVAFLDSDDTWVKEHLAHMARAIEETRGIAALYFADLIEPGGHNYWTKCAFAVDSQWELRKDAADWCLLRTQPMMLQASVLSRNIFEKLGGFPEEMRTREDTYFFFKLGFQYPVCAVKECGTIMHADDALRLTQVHHSRTTVFNEATIFMYRSLLETPGLSFRHKQALLAKLCNSHFQMGRVSMKQGKYSVGIKHLLLSLISHVRAPYIVVN